MASCIDSVSFLVFAWIASIFPNCLTAFDLFYTEENQASSSKIQCRDNDICNVLISGKEASKTGTIQCPSNQNCNIYCDGERSCFRSIIHCPRSADCNIKCNGKYGCRYFTVNAPSAGNALRIECNDYLACADSNILALNNDEGTLHISALKGNINYMLDGSTIQCPHDGICEIYASGYQAMKDMFINATLSRTLHIKISGKQGLMNTKIYCPNYEKQCVLDIYATKYRMLYETEIYAVDSLKDVSLICEGKHCNKKLANGGRHAPILFCGEQYDANCRLKLTSGQLYCGQRSDCQDWKHGKQEINHEDL